MDVFGPFLPLLWSPELMMRASAMGDYLRYQSAFPPHLSEFIILVASRLWSQQYEWSLHSPIALQAGVDPAVVEAIAEGRRPSQMSEEQEILYDFSTELIESGSVGDETYARTLARFGEKGVIDEEGITGYYTFLAMVIDVESRRPKISNVVGGLSGPAIRPIAVRMVYECRQAVRIPIIGMGGIAEARDVLEFMIAGATAVQVGTANFVDPLIWPKLLDGLQDYMRRHRIDRISTLVGTLDTTARDREWISS